MLGRRGPAVQVAGGAAPPSTARTCAAPPTCLPSGTMCGSPFASGGSTASTPAADGGRRTCTGGLSPTEVPSVRGAQPLPGGASRCMSVGRVRGTAARQAHDAHERRHPARLRTRCTAARQTSPTRAPGALAGRARRRSPPSRGGRADHTHQPHARRRARDCAPLRAVAGVPRAGAAAVAAEYPRSLPRAFARPSCRGMPEFCATFPRAPRARLCWTATMGAPLVSAGPTAAGAKQCQRVRRPVDDRVHALHSPAQLGSLPIRPAEQVPVRRAGRCATSSRSGRPPS